MAEDKNKKTERMDSLFLTGPGGMVYELPRKDAEKYLVTPQRVKDLGHLPITPYGAHQSHHSHSHSHSEQPAMAAAGETSDVEGRHLAWSPILGMWVWHSNYLYGTFLAADGYYYNGVHYHPYGTELGFI